jgi:hypothetical protein
MIGRGLPNSSVSDMRAAISISSGITTLMPRAPIEQARLASKVGLEGNAMAGGYMEWPICCAC